MKFFLKSRKGVALYFMCFRTAVHNLCLIKKEMVFLRDAFFLKYVQTEELTPRCKVGPV